MIRRGIAYLVRFLDNVEENPERYGAELSLYVADVALRRGLVTKDYDAVKDTFAYHFDNRDPKSDRRLVLLGSVAYHLGEEEKVGTVLRNLDNVVKEGRDRTLYWGEPPASCWRWWDDAVEATAKVLELKMLAEAESEQIPYVVDWLVDQRRGAVWKSTKDSAEAMKALMRYILNYPETTRPIVLTYAVNEATGALALDPLKFENPDERVSLEWGDFAPGDNKLTLERYRGEGPVFYTAAVEYYAEADQIPAVQGSVTLERNYYRVERYKKGGRMEEKLRPLERPLQPGEELAVELVVNSPYDFDYVVLEDPRPAGCVNVENASRFDWYINAYVELKADKRAVMFERLPRGETAMRYRLRAEVPGRYTALPARVYGMYSPDIGSSTASGAIEISE